MSKVDIISIAKALNLSKSTVSRAFKENSDINPNTKARILTLAKELNYRPNHYASQMRGQKSNTIAVVVPEIANNFFTQIIQGVETIAKENGYHVLIFVTDDDLDKEREFVTSISNGRVDGVLMSVTGEGKDHSYLHNIDFKKMPIVFFDRVYDDVLLPRIITDDYQSSFDATAHLINEGCQRIAYLVVNKEESIGKNRYLGYKDALAKYGIAYRDELVVNCNNSYDDNEVTISNLIAHIHVDGIFASVERLAFSTYYVCQRLGVVIPDDLKIIAFSSLQIAPLLSPGLSTVTQPAEEMGREGAKMLLQFLENESVFIAPKEVVLHSELVIRKSSLC
ncbi:LacI family DNA-binding transcriptional regulator [Sphingobacterium rhinopitheci]|uniref:LacI family DNA-binding transcriptional regulator n=1 Tax=Sphingobacterium rhinopitheci TaxID=2781960 RepID=UPI001F51791C|nr:LacI family DNA-binding transcriptional regulator [Sphingobacterium rhinopitheci]MCI0920695.1 LacI family DNA-binding transcriptional regulator [Sphingobacterium rhinopitheci]